jgi:diamine N-acetyltransferase
MNAEVDSDLSARLRVRAALPSDAARLALLGKATFLESYAHLLPVDDILVHTEHKHAPAVYASWLADATTPCWIAEVVPGAAPVGYLVATPPDLPLDDLTTRDLEIRRIYLLHQFQGFGLGRQMMQAALDTARAMGMQRALLGVYSRNTAALAFYARLGFQQVGTRQFRVGANEYFDYILAHRW